MGFNRSFEKALTFPLVGTGVQPGGLWIESTGTPDPLDMTFVTNPVPGEASARLAAAFFVQQRKSIVENGNAGVAIVAGQIVQTGEATAIALANTANNYLVKPIDAVGQAVLAEYLTGVTVAGNVGGTVIYKAGNVISDTKEKTGNLIDATEDFAKNTTASINPDVLQLGPVTIPVMRIRLIRQPAPQPFGSKSNILSVAATSDQAPYAWMTVHVPADAGFLAFDFTVTGQPEEDRIVCAINDRNVFDLPAKFAPNNVPSSTDLIDVSALPDRTSSCSLAWRAARPRHVKRRSTASVSSPYQSRNLRS